MTTETIYITLITIAISAFVSLFLFYVINRTQKRKSKQKLQQPNNIMDYETIHAPKTTLLDNNKQQQLSPKQSSGLSKKVYLPFGLGGFLKS